MIKKLSNSYVYNFLFQIKIYPIKNIKLILKKPLPCKLAPTRNNIPNKYSTT